MQAPDTDKKTVFSKLKFGGHIAEFVAIAIYFTIWFMAVSYVRYTMLKKAGVPLTSFEWGILRALICAKIMLIAKVLYPIKLRDKSPLCWHILNRSIIYLAFVIGLNVLEQLIRAKSHGIEIGHTIAGLASVTINQSIALIILYWLMLIPYVTYAALSQALGTKVLFRMLFVGNKS